MAQPENPGDDTIIKGNPLVGIKCNVAFVLYCIEVVMEAFLKLHSRPNENNAGKALKSSKV